MHDPVHMSSIMVTSIMSLLQLQKLGFKKIDGLDPSPEMLDEAKKRDLYDNYLLEFVTQEPLNLPESEFDNNLCETV